MSGIINYSKFDKIEVSSSDEEAQYRKPHITTLNSQDKVVLGPEGLTVLKAEQKKEKEKKEETDNTNTDPVHIENEKKLKEKKENEEKIKTEKKLKEMIENGGVVPNEYMWSQSPHEITAHIILPKNTKAKDLSVQIYEDKLFIKKKKSVDNTEEKKKTNDENNNQKFKESYENKEYFNDYRILINEFFPFKVYTDDETCIWEIKNIQINWKEIFDLSNKINNQNLHFNFQGDLLLNKEETFLYISLKKKNDIGNCYIWWSGFFKNGPHINVANLKARLTNNKQGNLKNFKNMWDQAHKIFKENIAKKKLPLPID